MHSWYIPIGKEWRVGFWLGTYPFTIGLQFTVSPKYERIDLWVYLGPIAFSVGLDRFRRYK